MVETKLNLSETTKESIPTPEEVRLVLRELIGGEYTKVREREDEEGLYLLEVTVPGELKGEVTEYLYLRKGQYPEGESEANEIHVVFYKDDMPISGTSAARHLNGRWVIL